MNTNMNPNYVPPSDDSPFIDPHAAIPSPSQMTEEQARGLKASIRNSNTPPPEPERSKGMFMLITLLFIPAVLYFVFAGYVTTVCILACGLGGSEFAKETMLTNGIWLISAIAIIVLLISLQKKARKGIATGRWRWITLGAIALVVIIYSWNMIMLALTGNLRYDDRLVDYNSEIRNEYKGVDCKTVKDFAGEIDCWNANDDDYFGHVFHFVAAEKDACNTFNNAYNRAACEQAKIYASLNHAVGAPAYDPYRYVPFCMSLDLAPMPQAEHIQDPHYNEINQFLPYLTYGQQTKEGSRINCMEELFLSDDEYHANIYEKAGVENRYLYSDEPIPEFVIANQDENCASQKDDRLKDICYAVSADLARHKQGFGNFCDKINDVVPGLKANCFALRAERDK